MTTNTVIRKSRKKEVCKKGHSLTGKNLISHIIMREGKPYSIRQCHTCKKASQREYHKQVRIKLHKIENIEKIRAQRNRSRIKTGCLKKQNARRNLIYHVQRGHIKRIPCEVCGSEKVQAHHKDYSKPLEVVWLCITHHAELHRLEREHF